MNCLLCGTEIVDNYCQECADGMESMGFDYDELMEAL